MSGPMKILAVWLVLGLVVALAFGRFCQTGDGR